MRLQVRGHSVQAELVALDVLHHQARLVEAIGPQQPHAGRAEREQPGALGLSRTRDGGKERIGDVRKDETERFTAAEAEPALPQVFRAR